MSNLTNSQNKVSARPISTKRLTILPLFHIKAQAILDYHTRNRDFLKPTSPSAVSDFFTEAYWQRRIWQARQDWENQKSALFVLTEKQGEAVIGSVNFNQMIKGVMQSCFLGYSLDQDFQSKGYMTEALTSLIEHIFADWELHRIQANYLPSNMASARVLEKLGFEKEGYAKNYLRINGQWQDHVLTAKINPEEDKDPLSSSDGFEN